METLLGKLVVASIGVGALFSGLLNNNLKLIEPPTIQYEVEPIKDKLDTWLDKLETYENCPVEGIVDTNHKLSYGCLCFQFFSFKTYVRKYNLFPYTEDNELFNLIGECKLQKKLSRLMILDNYNNWKHWWTSVGRGLGLPPKGR